MEIALLSQVIPIQDPLLFPPACFRKGSSVLGKKLCSVSLEGGVSRLGSLRASQGLTKARSSSSPQGSSQRMKLA